MSTVSMAPFTADEAIPPRELSRSPTKGSPRRALGPLSPNVQLSAPDPPFVVVDGKSTTTPNGSPLKGQLSLTPADILSMKDTYGRSPYLTSKKRSFAQFDGACDEDELVAKSPFISGHAASIEGRVLAEAQAVIDSPSHVESPPEPEEHPRTLSGTLEAPNAQATNASFSSLIDYDPAAASDKSLSAASSPPGRLPSEEPLSVQESFYRLGRYKGLTPKQWAQTLKLRLQLAAYKVRTNQELLPFDALEPIPVKTTRPSTALPVQPPQDDRAQSPDRPLTGSTVPLDGAPKLLPAPVLLPTASSSRKIEYVHSSPPRSPEKEGEELATPVAARRVQQLMSLPGSGNVTSPEKDRVEFRDDITSSVVKGQAASSLMELMRRG